MFGDADQRSHLLCPAVLIALVWTPYADWIYAVVSCTGLVMFVLLVLKAR